MVYYISFEKMNVLVLHSNVPAYFLSSMREGVKLGHSYLVIQSDFDVNAPYRNKDEVGIEFRTLADLKNIKAISFDLILVTRWRFTPYLKFIIGCKLFNRKTYVLAGIDMPWLGNFRQLVLCKSRFVKFFYNNILVPGKASHEYAEKLGYTKPLKNFYCAAPFKGEVCIDRGFKSKTLLFIGRLVEYKRVGLLCETFIEILSNHPELSDWKLQIIGLGPVQLPNHAQIEKLGYVENEEIGRYLAAAHSFVLPSRLEHWGVVVHEAAQYGKPLILSQGVMSRLDLLKHGCNGFQFLTKADFRNALLNTMKTKKSEYRKMSAQSVQAAKKISSIQLWQDVYEEVIDYR